MSGDFEHTLINWELRNFTIIFSTVFILIFFCFVGFVSRKVKTVLAFTVVTTFLIFFLLMVTRTEYGLSFFSVKF